MQMDKATADTALKSRWLPVPDSESCGGLRAVFECEKFPRITVSQYAAEGGSGFATVYHVDRRGAFATIVAAIGALNLVELCDGD